MHKILMEFSKIESKKTMGLSYTEPPEGLGKLEKRGRLLGWGHLIGHLRYM